MARPGIIFVRLDANFQDDEKIIDVSAEAELLYVRSLAYAKRLLSDGSLPRAIVMRRLCDKFATPEATVKELVASGLWDECDGGWRISAWAKHNTLSTDIEQARGTKRAGGRLGNHRRWNHEGPLETCQKCNGDRMAGSESHTDTDRKRDTDGIGSPEAEAEAEAEILLRDEPEKEDQLFPTPDDPMAQRDDETYTQWAARWLEHEGTELPAHRQRDKMFRAVLDGLVRSLEPERHHNATMNVCGDYVERITGAKMPREAFGMLARMVSNAGAGPGALQVFDALAKSVNGASDLDPQWKDDPRALTRYANGILRREDAA